MNKGFFLALALWIGLFFTGRGDVRAGFGEGDYTPMGEPQPAAMDSESFRTIPGLPSKLGYRVNGSVGAAAVTDPDTGKIRVFNTLALQPELAFWKLGVGLDLYVYMDKDGKARKGDWNSSKDLVAKIWYLRWGKKGEPFYFHLGGIGAATLGHGFIMRGYSNRLGYPDVRKTGLLADIDLGWVGIESVLSEVERTSFYGGRFFLRPLHGADVPLLSRMAIGATGVTDQDPDGNKGTAGDQVTIYGVDLDLPVFSSDFFEVLLYGDAAVLELGSKYTAQGSKNHGKGFVGGLGGKILFFDYRAEYRSTENNFIPTYFDSYYDVDRFDPEDGLTKADSISGSSRPGRHGPFAELCARILGKISLAASYETFNLDPLEIYPRVRAELRTDPSLFLGKFRFGARFEKRSVDQFRDLSKIRGQNTIMTTEFAYLPTPRLSIVVTQKQTFDQEGNPVRTTQFRTNFRF